MRDSADRYARSLAFQADLQAGLARQRHEAQADASSRVTSIYDWCDRVGVYGVDWWYSSDDHLYGHKVPEPSTISVPFSEGDLSSAYLQEHDVIHDAPEVQEGGVCSSLVTAVRGLFARLAQKW